MAAETKSELRKRLADHLAEQSEKPKKRPLFGVLSRWTGTDFSPAEGAALTRPDEKTNALISEQESAQESVSLTEQNKKDKALLKQINSAPVTPAASSVTVASAVAPATSVTTGSVAPEEPKKPAADTKIAATSKLVNSVPDGEEKQYLRNLLQDAISEKKILDQEYKKTEQQYGEEKARLQWAQAFETFGQALTRLGAGAYGLKHNVDLSGLKFDKNDWLAEQKLAQAEYQSTRDNILRKQQAQIDARTKVTEKLADIANRTEQRKLEIAERQKDRDSAEQINRDKLAADKMQPGQKSDFYKRLDQKMADQLGNFSGVRENRNSIVQLQNAINQLEKDPEISGQVWQILTPDWAEKKIAGGLEAGTGIPYKSVRSAIERVVQKDMKNVLGGQFARVEGEELLKRTFDTSVPSNEIAYRTKFILKTMQEAADVQQKAAEHLQQYGTLQGFPFAAELSKQYTTEDLIPPSLSAEQEPAQQQLKTENPRAELERRRAIKQQKK